MSRFDGREVINLASNNYLGLADHPKLIEAQVEAAKKYGAVSARFVLYRHYEHPLELGGSRRSSHRSVRRVSIRFRGERRNGVRAPRA